MDVKQAAFERVDRYLEAVKEVLMHVGLEYGISELVTKSVKTSLVPTLSCVLVLHLCWRKTALAYTPLL